MRSFPRVAAIAAATLATAGLVACDPGPEPTSFTITRLADGPDAQPGDGICEVSSGARDCSLRAAVEEGNALGGPILVTVGVPASDATIDGGSAPITVTTSTTIDGAGASIDGRFVHTSGTFILRRTRLVGNPGPVCGSAVRSTGDLLGLDRVRIEDVATWTGEPVVCASGGLAVVDSTIAAATNGPDTALIAVDGPVLVDRSTIENRGGEVGPAPGLRAVAGPVIITNTTVLGFDPGTAHATVRFSWIAGGLTERVDVAASNLSCTAGSAVTSRGHNLDVRGLCGAATATDRTAGSLPPYQADLSDGRITFAPHVGSPLVGAIPAGTANLCDGTFPSDQRGEPRGTGRACDIGPYQTQVDVDVLDEQQHPGDSTGPVRVNASGTVAATFVDGDGTPTVGRWEPDGTFTSSGDPDTTVNDIGDDGVIVGHRVVDGVTRPWRWAPDQSPELVTGPGGLPDGTLFAIDDVDGTIVGSSRSDSQNVLWYQAPGQPAVTLPATDRPRVTAVHDGIAVGSRYDPGGWEERPVRWDLRAGTATDLSLIPTPAFPWPEGPYTRGVALDLAPGGTIVGSLQSGSRAVTWQPDGAGAVVPFLMAREVVAITDDGDMVMRQSANLPCYLCGPVVVPAGTSDARMLLSDDLNVWDLGDDGTLVGTRDVATAGGGSERRVVRLRLVFGDGPSGP